MSVSLKELYKEYIQQKLSLDTFRVFKKELNDISDNDLWDVMLDMGNDQSPQLQMPASVKHEILKELKQVIWRRRLNTFMKYAAAVLVVSSLSYSIYVWLSDSKPQMLQVAVKSGDKAEMTLPDGTNVHLNAVSKLQYNINTNKERFVKLTGEAFFNVAPNDKLPFRVQVDDLIIEVVGTSFNVNSYKNGIVETTLLTGVVKLSGESLPKEYILSPGEKARYSSINKTLQITDSDTRVEAGWCDDYLIFYSTPFVDVIAKIERWYGVEIDLKQPKIANDLLSGSFRNENIENVIESLSMQYGFDYKIDKNKIVIY